MRLFVSAQRQTCTELVRDRHPNFCLSSTTSKAQHQDAMAASRLGRCRVFHLEVCWRAGRSWWAARVMVEGLLGVDRPCGVGAGCAGVGPPVAHHPMGWRGSTWIWTRASTVPGAPNRIGESCRYCSAVSPKGTEGVRPGSGRGPRRCLGLRIGLARAVGTTQLLRPRVQKGCDLDLNEGLTPG
jgi:hypothetical protein